MNYRQKHENFVKTIQYAVPENFLESLSAIEYNLLHPSSEATKCLVPKEANFQLPNIFLKTRNSFAVEKLFGKSRRDDNFNAELDKIIDVLDQIEFKQPANLKNLLFDEKILEILIKYRQ